MSNKTLDWNQMSKLGLIVKINNEVLHPLGLAISRNSITGFSECVAVAEDGFFEYSEDVFDKCAIMTNDEIKQKIKDTVSDSGVKLQKSEPVNKITRKNMFKFVIEYRHNSGYIEDRVIEITGYDEDGANKVASALKDFMIYGDPTKSKYWSNEWKRNIPCDSDHPAYFTRVNDFTVTYFDRHGVEHKVNVTA